MTHKMAEFVYSEEKIIGIDEPITLENNTGASFDVSVGVGIIFQKSGLYRVSVDGKHTSIEIEPERQKGKWILKKELVPLPWDSGPLDWGSYDEKTHSEWKEYYHCSNCDWKSGESKGGNFCPHCGSCNNVDMREGEEN